MTIHGSYYAGFLLSIEFVSCKWVQLLRVLKRAHLCWLFQKYISSSKLFSRMVGYPCTHKMWQTSKEQSEQKTFAVLFLHVRGLQGIMNYEVGFSGWKRIFKKSLFFWSISIQNSSSYVQVLNIMQWSVILLLSLKNFRVNKLTASLGHCLYIQVWMLWAGMLSVNWRFPSMIGKERFVLVCFIVRKDTSSLLNKWMPFACRVCKKTPACPL